MIRMIVATLVALLAPMVACGPGTNQAAAQAEVEPVVPFGLFSAHWDHHWFAWLPRHPVYEAVEVMSTPGQNGRPLVWVFFTERRPPKRQISYVNDRAVARGAGWQYRDIDYTTSGAAGAPLDLSVHMAIEPGTPLAISIEFDPATPLHRRDSTLTPQIGHGAADRFLLFHRGEDAVAARSSIVVGAEDLSLPIDGHPDPLPFHAAYSHDIFVGSIPFAETRWSYGGPSAAMANATVFARQAPQGGEGSTYVAAAGPGQQLELVVDATDGLRSYTDRRGNRALQVLFQPPLPGVGAVASGTSAFSIAYGDLGTIVTGQVRCAGDAAGLSMDWQPQSPAWATAYRFRSRAERTGPDGIVVRTSARGPDAAASTSP